MAIDDELEKSSVAAEIRDEAERPVQELLRRTGIAGALSLIPFGVGASINEMLAQLAQRRTHERMNAIFDEMAQHIRDLGEEKIDRDWFRGDEFQTLMFEALHQLHVTHNKEKVEMLGKALANSGATEFKEETRKQLFVQLIRDLTPQHVVLLNRLSPRATMPGIPQDDPNLDWLRWQHRPEIMGEGSDMLILQMLAANGLVEENLKVAIRGPSGSTYSSQSQVEKAIRDFVKEVQKPPLRYFRLSKLGMDFLKFVGSKQPENLPREEEKPSNLN